MSIYRNIILVGLAVFGPGVGGVSYKSQPRRHHKSVTNGHHFVEGAALGGLTLGFVSTQVAGATSNSYEDGGKTISPKVQELLNFVKEKVSTPDKYKIKFDVIVNDIPTPTSVEIQAKIFKNQTSIGTEKVNVTGTVGAVNELLSAWEE